MRSLVLACSGVVVFAHLRAGDLCYAKTRHLLVSLGWPPCLVGNPVGRQILGASSYLPACALTWLSVKT